jgi:serine O-acetyltransferase
MSPERLRRLKLRMRRLWVVSPERLWLLSIALNDRGHGVLAFWIKQLNTFLYHNSLAPGAKVSPDVFLGHNSMGIVINRNVEIGERVTIWHNVTLAAGRLERRRRGSALPSEGDPIAPSENGASAGARARIVIEDGVKIGAGAVVMAPRATVLRIGRGARIGAGTVVTRDVPAGATVVGQSPRVLLRDASGQGAEGTPSTDADISDVGELD